MLAYGAVGWLLKASVLTVDKDFYIRCLFAAEYKVVITKAYD